MGAPNDARALYAAAGAVLLLVADAPGQRLRFARVPTAATDAHGVEHLYQGGMTLGAVDDSLGADGRTLGVSLQWSGWATLTAAGVDLEGTPVEVSLYAVGFPPVVLFRGRLTDVAWADPKDPDSLTATMDATPYAAPRQVPDPQTAITLRNWPTATGIGEPDPAVAGQFVPIVYGQPGAGGLIGTTESGPGSPIMAVEFSDGPDGNDSFLAACQGQGGDGLEIQVFTDTGVVGTATLTTKQDKRNQWVSGFRWGDLTTGTPTAGAPYYAGWISALDRSPTSIPTLLGDVLIDQLRRSGLPMDLGRCVEQGALLEGFRVDTFLNTPTDPVTWIRSAILPVFPVSLGMSPGGIYFYALRDAVADTDVIAELDADGGRVVRQGAVQTTPWADIVNACALRYAWRADTDTPRSVVYVDGDESAPAVGVLHITSARARWSQGQPWGTRFRSLDSRTIGNDATGQACALSLVNRLAAPWRRGVFLCGRSFLGLYPGAYVRVLDTPGIGPRRTCRVTGRSVLPASDAAGARVALTVETI